MSEKPPVLLLQLGEAPDPVKRVFGTYPSWYQRAWGGPMAVHDGRRPGPLPDPKDFAGMVITGSASSLAAQAPESWIEDAADLVHRAHRTGTPTLGVCFGHQLIAWAFGARVVKNPKGWEIGSQEVDLNDQGRTDPLFGGLSPRLRVNLTHEDVVDPGSLAGTPVRNLATSARCQVQALAVDDHVRAVQFHPELTGAICRAYILARRIHVGDEADALLENTADAPDGVAVLQNFRRTFVCA